MSSALNPIGVCLIGVYALSTPASADYVRSVTEIMDFSNGYVMADGSIYDGWLADETNAAVRDAWPTLSRDFVVVRFYALFNDPDDRMVLFGNTADGPLRLNIVSPAGRQVFEDEIIGGTLPPQIAAASAIPTLAFDSWFTIGGATIGEFEQNPGRTGTLGTLPTSMADGLDMPGQPEAFLWAIPHLSSGESNPVALPDDQGRVLYAQITVPRGTRFGFSGTIGFVPAGEEAELRRTFSFAAVPTPGALALLAIAGLGGSRRRR